MNNDVCACGCGQSVKPGGRYASRGCANKAHGLARIGTPKRKAWAEKCGHGRAVEVDRFALNFR
jgi:hypothetical protein